MIAVTRDINIDINTNINDESMIWPLLNELKTLTDRLDHAVSQLLPEEPPEDDEDTGKQ